MPRDHLERPRHDVAARPLGGLSGTRCKQSQSQRRRRRGAVPEGPGQWALGGFEVCVTRGLSDPIQESACFRCRASHALADLDHGGEDLPEIGVRLLGAHARVNCKSRADRGRLSFRMTVRDGGGVHDDRHERLPAQIGDQPVGDAAREDLAALGRGVDRAGHFTEFAGGQGGKTVTRASARAAEHGEVAVELARGRHRGTGGRPSTGRPCPAQVGQPRTRGRIGRQPGIGPLRHLIEGVRRAGGQLHVLLGYRVVRCRSDRQAVEHGGDGVRVGAPSGVDPVIGGEQGWWGRGLHAPSLCE